MSWEISTGDCLDLLPGIPDHSVDAIITDPPYPEIDRDYGRLSEAAWWELMMGVCAQARRILKPSGSAVFILQPNSEKVGKMRGWLWRFMAWVCDEWGMVQDCWWWNNSAPPTVHTHRDRGLMRPSVKAMVWAGDPGCYRDQSAVLMPPAEASVNDKRVNDSELKYRNSGSGHHGRGSTSYSVFRERGGVTPFNLLVMGAGAGNSSGNLGHGAGTPLALAAWWTRYIVPAGGVVVDPFCGAGTMGVAAAQHGADFIGYEKIAKYADISRDRLQAAPVGFDFSGGVA